MFTEVTWNLQVSIVIIQNIFNLLQLSKEKQFTRGKTAFLQAQKAQKIQEQEKPLLKVSMEISKNLPKADLKKHKIRTSFDN